MEQALGPSTSLVTPPLSRGDVKTDPGHDTAVLTPPCLLFDDARARGAPPRLYRDPLAVLEARTVAEVAPALATVRTALAAGRHVAGFLSYEAAPAFDRAPVRPSPTPLAWFGVFAGYATPDVAAFLPDTAGAWLGAPEPEITPAAYDAAIARVLSLIAAGDIYQANLTFRTRVPLVGDPLAAYARLRAASRAGWGAYVDTGADTLLSLSPELFFAAENGALTCRPMKGTARRRADPQADRAAAAALVADAKQRAENLMIVDLMRNDLARVAAPGSVRVPALFAVEHYPSVHQLTSTVTARLAEGRDALDVLAALFPCGSITGAPKLRAMEVIAEVEPDLRGLYTGAIGWFHPNGAAQFNVAIRTLHVAPGARYATLGLGGGIVADSRADAEWDEALAKGAFVTMGERAFDLIETMAFDPEAGVLLIERHLARMKASADTFGFPFDRHAARNELQAATFRLRGPARLRLLLARSGAIAIEVAPRPATPARLTVEVVPLPVAPADFRLRHKTTDRGFYDAARHASAADEVVFVDSDDRLTEGSYTSLFVPRGATLVTPPLARGLLPGVLREELLATGRAVEDDLTPADLAEGFFVGNALRGLIPAVAVAKSSLGSKTRAHPGDRT
jgi:para-aminobenzoate synthetase/4-amino-4-deoxychorismate lyase